MTARYVEQLDRTKRYLKRFTDLTNGIPHTHDTQYYDDEVYAFFQNCYHLKDWIIHDPICHKWSSVEKFINSDKDLQICADICNNQKHLKLTKSPRSKENPEFAGGIINLNIRENLGGDSSVGIAISYEVSTNSGNIDAFALATRCVNSWVTFIASNT